MSVRANERKESALEFLNTAHELEKFTLQVVMNERIIPKRYRYMIGQQMCNSAMELSKNITYANSIYPKTKQDYEMRREYQHVALGALKNLCSLIRLAYEVLPIKGSVVTQWSTLLSKEEGALRSWINSDNKRYKDLS